MRHCYASKVFLTIFFENNQYILHIGKVCVATGMDLQESPFSLWWLCFGIMWLLVKKIKLKPFSEISVCFTKEYRDICNLRL